MAKLRVRLRVPVEPVPVESVRVGERVAYILAAVVAFVVADREVEVVGHALIGCRVTSDAAFGFVLGGFLVLLTAAHFVVLSVAIAVYARTRVPAPWILLVTGVVLLAGAWAFLAWNGLPMVNEACPGGEPGSWPSWLPPRVETQPMMPGANAG